MPGKAKRKKRRASSAISRKQGIHRKPKNRKRRGYASLNRRRYGGR